VISESKFDGLGHDTTTLGTGLPTVPEKGTAMLVEGVHSDGGYPHRHRFFDIEVRWGKNFGVMLMGRRPRGNLPVTLQSIEQIFSSRLRVGIQGMKTGSVTNGKRPACGERGTII